MAFVDLLEQLAEEFGTDLRPDLHGICLLLINEKLKVQLEVDVTGENLLMACLVSELPPGRFRENILKNALKANHLIEENFGTLSYTGPDNALVLSTNLLMHGLTGRELYEFLSIFVGRATAWQKAIDEGHPYPLDSGEVPQPHSSQKIPLFGFQE